jgi:hypothetical protein
VALSIVVLIVCVVGLLVLVRQLAPERPMLLQGMFRYEGDLGWPHGVQEQDGERAWVPRATRDWDPDEDELTWTSLVGSSTMSDRDGDRPLDPVTVVKVERDRSATPRRRDP